MNAFAIEALVKYVNHRTHLSNYMFVSAATILVYDYMLTMHLEIKFIWLSKWSYTTALYLSIRCLAFSSAALVMWTDILPDHSLKACQALIPVTEWTMIVLALLAEVVMAIRTWAVWRRNRVVGFGLGFMMITHIAFQCQVSSKKSHSITFLSPPYPGFEGCFTKRTGSIVWQIAATTVVEAILLVLMIISAFRLYREGNSGQLANIIHRDDILCYVYLLVLNAMIIPLAFVNPSFSFALTLSESMLCAVFTCRLVLAIREANSYSTLQSELHTTNEQRPLSELRFQPKDPDEDPPSDSD